MKLKRSVHVTHVTDYNALAHSVNSEKIVIFIEGKLYDEMESKAKLSRSMVDNKILGSILLAGGVLTGGVYTAVMGGILTILSKVLKDDFKKYKVKINKDSKRIELYLKVGKQKYDSNYDSLIY